MKMGWLTKREMQKRLKELAAALKADPGSVPRRLELAAALKEAGRAEEAIELYRGVAEAYAQEGRLVQAMAICKGILDIDPRHRETLEMLASLAKQRAAPGSGDAARWQPEDTTNPVPFTTIPDGGGPDQRPTQRSISAMIEEETAREPAGPRTEKSMPAITERSIPTVPPPDTTEPTPRFLDSELRGPALTRAGSMRAASERSAPAGGTLVGPGPAAASLNTAPDGHPIERGLYDEEPGLYADQATVVPSGEVSEPGLYAEDDEMATRLVHDAMTAPFPKAPTTGDPPPFPLLSELPRSAFMELLARLTVVKLPAGATILREGEIGDACYLIAAGSVRVTKGGVELAVLPTGSFFGEFAVLADQRRHASVETIEAVELLEIRRALLDELVSSHAGVARTLRRFYRQRLLSTLLATAPFFAGLSPEERKPIAERFRPRRFGRGARIIEEGAPGGGFFLILVGEVEVLRGTGDKEIVLGRVGEGSYFGEMSLLRGSVATATVRAARTTEVVQLAPRDFYEIVSQHPILWDELRTEAERRSLANHAILTGEARKNADGSIYLV